MFFLKIFKSLAFVALFGILCPLLFASEKPIIEAPVLITTEALEAEQRQTEYFMQRKKNKKILVKEADKRLNLKTDLQDVTRYGNVRMRDLKLGVDYNLNDTRSLGVGFSKEIQDFQDASSWNKNLEPEEAIAAKYKVRF